MNITKNILHNLIDDISDYDNQLVYDFLFRLSRSKKVNSLTEYLNRNCDFVDEEEQKEISKILSTITQDYEGKEINIEQFLQSQI